MQASRTNDLLAIVLRDSPNCFSLVVMFGLLQVILFCLCGVITGDLRPGMSQVTKDVSLYHAQRPSSTLETFTSNSHFSKAETWCEGC